MNGLISRHRPYHYNVITTAPPTTGSQHQHWQQNVISPGYCLVKPRAKGAADWEIASSSPAGSIRHGHLLAVT